MRHDISQNQLLSQKNILIWVMHHKPPLSPAYYPCYIENSHAVGYKNAL